MGTKGPDVVYADCDLRNKCKLFYLRMARNNDRVYDEMLCFLGEPIYQIPVRSFMDENCLSKFCMFYITIIVVSK